MPRATHPSCGCCSATRAAPASSEQGPAMAAGTHGSPRCSALLAHMAASTTLLLHRGPQPRLLPQPAQSWPALQAAPPPLPGPQSHPAPPRLPFQESSGVYLREQSWEPRRDWPQAPRFTCDPGCCGLGRDGGSVDGKLFQCMAAPALAPTTATCTCVHAVSFLLIPKPHVR